MHKSNKENKRNGILGTFLFHAFLIFSFFFLGLKYQDPPPREEGISVNFGFMEEGMNNSEYQTPKKETEVLEENIETKKTETNNTETTQEKLETISIKEKEIEQEKETTEKQNEKEEIEKKEEPKLNRKALYTGKKKSSEGKRNKKGDQGNIEGTTNSSIYNGAGIGKDGENYQLGSRKALNTPKPKDYQEKGIVVVNITVDRNGNVVSASRGKGTTNPSSQLWSKAKNAALKTKFEAKESATYHETGRIIYYFLHD
jgi:outer membrane biosynthesis protein TonB